MLCGFLYYTCFYLGCNTYCTESELCVCVQRRMWVKWSSLERVKTVCMKQSPWWQCVCVCVWEVGHSTVNEWVTKASCLFKINLQCQTRSDHWKHIRRWSGTDSDSMYKNVFSWSVNSFIAYIILKWCFPFVLFKRLRTVCFSWYLYDVIRILSKLYFNLPNCLTGSNLLRF